MPGIKRTVSATTDDALTGLNFKVQGRNTLVSLWASGAAAGGSISLLVGSQAFIQDAAVNLESGDRVVDTDRDQILFQEPCPPGEFFLPITLGGADITYSLNIEEV